MQEHISHTIAPVWDKNCTALILGTMPSPASRKAAFFYMHPQNRFWKVLSAVFNEPLNCPNSSDQQDAARKERTELLLRHHLAVWDVLADCEISGAQDSSIRNPVPNDFSVILETANIKKIFTTGQTAYKLYTRLCLPITHIPAVCLPSPSPANQGRWPLDKLIAVYSSLRGD